MELLTLDYVELYTDVMSNKYSPPYTSRMSIHKYT